MIPGMKKHRTKLIDGTFTIPAAKKLLLELLSYKINYHKIKQFSNKERFGIDRDHSEKRIQELGKEKRALVDWISTLEQDKKLIITCNIKMEKSR